MRLKNKQSGLTFISWLIILAIGGFFVLLALKLVPIYLENQSINSVIKSLESDPIARRGTVGDIRNLIRKRFRINGIYDFDLKQIKIKKTRNRMAVDLTYDRIEPIVANVSVMVSFSEKVDVELAP